MIDATSFLLALTTGPLLRGDAIVVLCGEDAEARLAVGLQLFAQRAGEVIVLSGGRHEPPAILGAPHCRDELVSRGVAPDRIIVEAESQHTRQQAEQVVALAAAHGWRRLLLVASAYHLPRAFLTFVRVLQETAGLDQVQVVPVPASQTPWWATPPGVDRTRMELWPVESVKIHEYEAAGWCANYREGLDYLKRWEGQ